jgi:hypothetical protein
MTVDDAAEQLRKFLIDVGFDEANPDPLLAWEAFKRFVVMPVEVPTTEVWFEGSDGDLASGSPVYFDFVRMFMHYPDHGAEWGEQITAHFTAPLSGRLGVRRGSIGAESVENLLPWFQAVETSPLFQAGTKIKGWSFEVRIDGC